jgi:hypothetical protein
MNKETTVIALGIFVVVVPYLGIPGDWRVALLVLAGLALAVVGFMLRGEALARGGRSARHTSFVESVPPLAATAAPHTEHTHEHKDGITSLN